MHFTSISTVLAFLVISSSLLSIAAAPALAPTDPDNIDYSDPPSEAKKRAPESVSVAKIGEVEPGDCTGDLLGKTLPQCGHTYKTRSQATEQASVLEQMTKRSPDVAPASPPVNSLKFSKLYPPEVKRNQASREAYTLGKIIERQAGGVPAVGDGQTTQLKFAEDAAEDMCQHDHTWCG